jgi:hypothetical protein
MLLLISSSLPSNGPTYHNTAPSVSRSGTRASPVLRFTFREKPCNSVFSHLILIFKLKSKQLNSLVWVRERTISTYRETAACRRSQCQLLRIDGATWSAWRPLPPYSWLQSPEPLLFFPSSFSVALTRLSGPRSRPTTSQEIWQRRESSPDFWICSQEPWPLDHRSGLRSST